MTWQCIFADELCIDSVESFSVIGGRLVNSGALKCHQDISVFGSNSLPETNISTWITGVGSDDVSIWG